MQLEEFLKLSKQEQVKFLQEAKDTNGWIYDLQYSIITRSRTLVSNNQKLSIAYDDLLPYFNV